LIAIGDSQGNVAIFNIRAEDDKPIASTKDLDNKHTNIVWEVQWVDRDTKPEALVSVAGDGRIIEWSMKRGLDMIELKALKRETNPNQQEVFSSANAEEKDKKGRMTFIETGGMAIDFPPAEKGINYFCATEDCSVHKCSISYPDQYMNSYYGHQGPVYRVRCNPYWDASDNAIFLTCSYDWTVKVWNANA
jgi:WD40 repeat protein